MAKSILDTNLIIRFLVDDDSKKSASVEKLLKDSRNINLLLDTVVAEIIWVLSSYYEVKKPEIIEKIRSLIHLDSISCNKDVLDRSLSMWERYNISFIDSYLAAISVIEDLVIYTYDQKFDSIKEIKSKEP